MDEPNLNKLDFDHILDYGFATLGMIDGEAERLDDPEAVLAAIRAIATDEEPVGVVCALFAFAAEMSAADDDNPRKIERAPRLAGFYWDYKQRLDLRPDRPKW